jgi:DNA-binding HxlR family transcriptional regulator
MTPQKGVRDAGKEERTAILERLPGQWQGNALRRSTLEAQLPDVDPVMIRHHLAELIREGRVTNYGGWLRRIGRRP